MEYQTYLPEETRHDIIGLHRMVLSKDLTVVLDMREEKTRYVGLICQIPFARGFMICPFIRKGLSFDMHKNIFPTHFKNTNKAWNWVKQHAKNWRHDRKYTIFNPLILYLGTWGQIFYVVFSEARLHLASTQLLLSPLLMFAVQSQNIIATIAIKTVAAIVGILGIINLTLLLHDRKSNKKGGNR